MFMLIGCFSNESKDVKVMTWNIWHGGMHGTKTDGFKKDTLNAINVLKVIEQEYPDVLFMP